MTEAIGGPVARIGQEARDYSRQFSSRFNPGVTSSGRRSPFVRIAVGFPRSCIIRLGIARRAFKRGKPWKRVACTSYAPHAPLHTRSNSLSNSASSVTFLPFFLFPILNARPLPLSLSLSRMPGVHETARKYAWCVPRVWETTIRIDGRSFLARAKIERRNDFRNEISGTKSFKMFSILWRSALEERFVVLFLFNSQFFGLGIKKRKE